MGAPEKRERAKHFSNQVTAKLNDTFGNDIHWDRDVPPSLKCVIKGKEIILKYNDTDEVFELYDSDMKTQKNETLGNFSPATVTDPNDSTVDGLVDKLKEYLG